MTTTRNAMLAAVCLGALHDILLHAVVGDHAVQEPEPEPERNDTSDFGEERDDKLRGFEPGCRASADLSGHTDGGVHGIVREAAVSQDFADGMARARRQFAGQEEDRFAEERQRDRERMDLEFHLHARATCLTLANSPDAPNEDVVQRAALFYDFLCHGARVSPNLSQATELELLAELTARRT